MRNTYIEGQALSSLDQQQQQQQHQQHGATTAERCFAPPPTTAAAARSACAFWWRAWAWARGTRAALLRSQMARRYLSLGPLALSLVLLLAFGDRGGGAARTLTQQQRAAGPPPGNDLKAFANAGCANASALAGWHPFRPGYHITVPYGWLNDPHGLFERGGLHHLFFQYNPKAIAWGAPFWGHVVSDDLARWRWLPPALLPDQEYDYSGAWSGAVTVDQGTGLPTISYTAAATRVPEYGNFFQAQALARPVDPSDRLLRRWAKSPANPVLVQTPPGGTNFQFRDTTPANGDVRAAVAKALAARRPRPAGSNSSASAAEEQEAAAAAAPAPRYAWALGTQAFCLGTAALYTAETLEGPWTFSGNLFNQLAVDPKVNGQCQAPPLPTAAASGGVDAKTAPRPLGPAYGGPCSQFGPRCRTWEVVDFAEVAPGVYAVKWADQDRARAPFSAEWYVLSDELRPAALRLRPDAYNDIRAADASAFDTLVSGRLSNASFAPVRLNYGSTYASKFERLKDGRLLMMTWLLEAFDGCIESCSDNTAAGAAYLARAPFKGALQLPRTVAYDAETRSLRLFPIAEIDKLRVRQLFSVRDRPLPANGVPVVLLPESAAPQPGTLANGNAAATTARQFHVRLEFEVQPAGAAGAGGANFTAGVRLLMGSGGSSYVDILLHGTVDGGNGSAALRALRLEVDRRRAGGFTPATADGGPVPLPAPPARPWAVPGKRLSLDVFVDHSVVEAYALDGLGRAATRVYPSDDSVAWGLAVLGSGGSSGSSSGGGVLLRSADAWALGNAWVGQPAAC